MEAPPKNRPRREKLLQRWGALKSERASWVSHWQEITTYLLPRNGRYFVQDRNRGEKRHNSIYDNTASRALKVMAAGLMAGATSPARPWFRLMAQDPDLNAYHPVRVWLEDVTRRMQRVFQASNTYRALHQMYEELGAFGTAVSIVLPDYQNVIHHYPITVGEFALAEDYQCKINTIYREFDKTIGEIVREFGRDRCSLAVRNLYDRGELDSYVTLIHMIEPRDDRDPGKVDAINMAWRSIYFEVNGDPETVLRESGFRQFPVLAPRWAVVGGDVYGHSPGMESLGDIKGLQHKQLRLAQVIDKHANPALQVPSSLKNRDVETLPGGISFVDSSGQQAGIRPLYEMRLDPSSLIANIEDDRQRIQRSFFADLFMMLANSTDQSKTATEVALLQEEKMIMLGPVLERLQNEMHEPLIDLTFTRMLEAGALPPPPEELAGQMIVPEFVSMLAQAQRAIGTNAVDRFVGNLSAIAQVKPEILDKFDQDEWVDSYTDMLGVDPNLVVADEKVAELREARNRALAAKEQAAAMQQQAATAKDLAAAPTGPGAQNALTDVMNMYSGYNSPAPSEVS